MCEKTVLIVMFGLHEYIRRGAEQMRQFTNDILVACAMYFASKMETKLLLGYHDLGNDPFGHPLASSCNLRSVRVPYYFLQRGPGFGILFLSQHSMLEHVVTSVLSH